MIQLKSIEELKARVAKGETLEKTQLQKIEGEAQLREELKAVA
jgi:translation initiation factor 2A